MLCFLAGRDVPLDEDELNGAVRRAELLLASPERRAVLGRGLEHLRDDVAGLRGARESLRLLLADADLAWRVYATSLLAEALAEE